MVSLRKINVLLVIIIVLMLLVHGIIVVLSIFGIINYSLDLKITGRRLFYPLVAHIVLSMYLYFKDRSKKFNKYSKLTSETKMQLVSGIAIIVFAGMHILSYMLWPPVKLSIYLNLLHLLIDILLFVSIAIHLKISVPRFMISIGFLQSKNSYQYTSKITNLIILIFLIIFVIAELKFYMGGIL